MLVRFWGVRGSYPKPGSDTSYYGGNTPCVEIRTDEHIIILDAGTGIIDLGNYLMANDMKNGPVKASLFLSHTHWDHIDGWPFFIPAYIPNNEFDIYGTVNFNESLEDTFSGQMKYQYFPVKLNEMQSKINFFELKETTFNLGKLKITTQYLNHPILVLGYRFEENGKSVVYATDTEPYFNIFEDPNSQDQDDDDIFFSDDMDSFIDDLNTQKLEFYQDADIVIHDSQYNETEYNQKKGWGHSRFTDCYNLADKANIKNMVLFHHDPARKDAELRDIEGMLQNQAFNQGKKFRIYAAKEGLELKI